MAKTAAQLLLDILVEYGVEYIFGLPGDSIDPLMEPLRRDQRIRFIQVRHEETGAFMASALAKKTGRLGVAMGTAGPGAIHLLNGLYDAKMDHAPVLALTGQVPTMLMGTDYFQEVDLVSLFSNVAVFNQLVSDPNQMAVMAGNACRTALAKRGVAHLSLPADVLQGSITEPVHHFGVMTPDLASVPVERDVKRAASMLARAKRPVILAGKGARGSRRELLALAEKLNIPVVNTLPAKGVIGDLHPLALGGLGLLGAKPAHEAMERTDFCLMVGTSYPYLQFLPKEAKVVQIDWEVSQIGKRRQVDVGLVGNAGPTLEQLTAAVQPQDPSEYTRDLQKSREEWLQWMAKKGDPGKTGEGRDDKDAKPINPYLVVNRLNRVVPDDANISIDVGNSLVWMARGFLVKNHGWLVSAWLGSMGFGLPAALAAKLVEPDRPSIAVVGDGGFSMLMADFVTAVKYNLPITVVILNNHRLGMIKFEQEVEGYPEFGTELTNPDFAAYARAAGGVGINVRHPDEVESALFEAVNNGRATIVDVETDPNEKPLPPRITIDQARGYATALFKETFGL